MCHQILIVAIVGFAVAVNGQQIMRNEKGKGANAEIGDNLGGGGKLVSGLVSGWEITKGSKCVKFYGKAINMPAGSYSTYLMSSTCSTSKNTSPSTLNAQSPGFAGTQQTGSNSAGTYLVVNFNVKGIDPTTLEGKSFVIASATQVVGCGDFKGGDMVVLKKDGVDEGTCA